LFLSTLIVVIQNPGGTHDGAAHAKMLY